MDRQRLIILLEMAMMAALAFVFSQIKVFEMPQGGSVSLVMVPIALIAVRRGLTAGVVTGTLVGLLQLMLGSTLVNPVQVLLDYPLAFAFLGLTGLVRLSRYEKKQQRVAVLWGGLLIGVLGRLACHFTSGVIWFGQYAPEGMNVALYSFVYNITYLIPEMIIAGVVLSVVLGSASQLLFPARDRVA
ncbi:MULTISPECIES: energy-coupled thiamine transporter ThiT [Brevibacillus]|uniref:Proton-coupled thiamine transporter YuaJ n=1 Tax=Brevibacillus parabrevis TaxID=54914 RepID=A0A4Y3PIQ6_BREPA|nr:MULTISPECIES: energy-coupled thiamine transporter ThiT [Brevibacillus]MBU8711555.1 energy-coupled thiamine transporter ThiT [Brevibacillus parabrevis]MDH6349817.1 thiamine transporter [Brevibacillus sp. 1238]MDR4999269.1 energy-coupled thiamine transporter ThiT [Brevibacillus parabrevis]MED1721856.1 energy-coupled thiamine transporter ThiT [Brevibacillus parabrevis]MED2254171.1 energy-coupled thiamine transporter ThiT [Brevibacillus parabrevis]